MTLPFHLAVGNSLILTDEHDHRATYTIRAIRHDGWMLEPKDRMGERHYFSGETIFRYYLAGRMTYQPWDDDVIPAARRRRLHEEFLAQPIERQLKAIRKRIFVRACEGAMRAGELKGAALARVPADVVSEFGDKWQAEDSARARKAFELREAACNLRPGECFAEPPRFPAPCPRTMWEWIRRYVEGGRRLNALFDNDAEKGRRGSQLSAAQEEELEAYFHDHVRPGRGFNQAAAFREFKKVLERRGVAKISRKTFLRRLRLRLNQRALATVEHGRRAVQRKFEVAMPVELPLWPLHQVEGDHVYLNIKVIDPISGLDCGPPWLSVLRDRSTGAPCGLHVSHYAPCWTSLSRVIAHAMWPKDLSGMPSIKGGWPVHGVFDELYTDRGSDFLCNAMRWASATMNFDLLNLPGYSGYLKGGLERWNREVKAEIMTFRDGVTAFRDPEYRGLRQPTMTLDELRASLVEWVVDDFLVNPHSGLDGKATPLEAWQDGEDLFGPRRPVEDFQQFRRMVLTPFKRAIQNRGIEIDGFYFRDLEGRLTDLRQRHEAPDTYLVLADPWDMSRAELSTGSEWIELYNTTSGLEGVSRARSEMYWDEAKLSRPGAQLTVDDFRRAREFVDADAERVRSIGKRLNRHGSQSYLGRYLEQGQFMTPIPLFSERPKPRTINLPGWSEESGVLRPTIGPAPEPAAHGLLREQGNDDSSERGIFRDLAAAVKARTHALDS